MTMVGKLDVEAGAGQVNTQEWQVCVLAALEEVTRQQRSLRRTLDRLVRRENREEVRHLLDMTETEEEDQDQERPGLFMGSEHEQIGRSGEHVNGYNSQRDGEKEMCNTRLHLKDGPPSGDTVWLPRPGCGPAPSSPHCNDTRMTAQRDEQQQSYSVDTNNIKVSDTEMIKVRRIRKMQV